MSNGLMQAGNPGLSMAPAGIEQIPYSTGINNPLGDIGNRFILANQIASTLMYATLIPDHLRGERKNQNGSWQLIPYSPEQVKANVLMVVNRALQWGVDPIALIAESFVVGGKLDFQGKVITAVVNALGGLKNNLTFSYSGSGESLTVTVTGTLKNESTPRIITLSYKDAVTKDKQGKPNEQWTKDVESKLAYSGAKKWARRHTPGVVLGLFAEDDDDDVPTVDGNARPFLDNKTLGEVKRNPVMQSYEDRIAEITDRDELTALVNKIRAEPLEVLEEAETDYLVSMAKHRFRNIRPAVSAEPKLDTSTSQVNEAPDNEERVLQYEAHINESASSEEVQRWVDAIDKDPHLSPGENKALGKFANERVKRGFES
jgi:hypothetical protein